MMQEGRRSRGLKLDASYITTFPAGYEHADTRIVVMFTPVTFCPDPFGLPTAKRGALPEHSKGRPSARILRLVDPRHRIVWLGHRGKDLPQEQMHSVQESAAHCFSECLLFTCPPGLFERSVDWLFAHLPFGWLASNPKGQRLLVCTFCFFFLLGLIFSKAGRILDHQPHLDLGLPIGSDWQLGVGGNARSCICFRCKLTRSALFASNLC